MVRLREIIPFYGRQIQVSEIFWPLPRLMEKVTTCRLNTMVFPWFSLYRSSAAQEIGKFGPRASLICCALLPTSGLCCPSRAHGRRAAFVKRDAQLFDDERESLSEGILENMIFTNSISLFFIFIIIAIYYYFYYYHYIN